MAEKLSDVVGAPVRRTLGGREYTFHPIMLEDLAAIERWLQDRPAERMARLLAEKGKSLPADVQNKLMADALKRGAEMDVGNPEIWRELRSIEGTVMFLWLSMRSGMPGLTLAQAAEILNTENIGELRRALEVVSGLRARPGEEAPAQEGAPGEPGSTSPSRPTGPGSSESSPSATAGGQKSSGG